VKNLKKLSLGLVVFSFVFIFNICNFTYANENIEVFVETREGSESYTVEKIMEESCEELLIRAVGEDNVKGSRSDYGFMVEEINGLRETYSDTGAYYELLVDMGNGFESSSMGISNVMVTKDLNAIMLHVNKNTGEAKLSYADGILKLEKKTTDYDENWNPIEVISSVSNGKLIIDGVEYQTDENGELKIELEAKEYEVKASKELEDGYPEIKRLTFILTVFEEEVFTGNLDDYKTYSMMEVKNDKEFIITFNKNVDGSLVDNNSIYIVDENNIIINPILNVLENKITVSNENIYEEGKKYYLIIEDILQSVDDISLDQKQKLEFDIAS
jgi:hypothetical protein